MPHLTLELSANLGAAAREALDAAVATCQASGHFEQAVIMARVVVHECFAVRQQGATAFANLTLRIRPGRSREIRAALSAALAQAIADVLARGAARERTCITCEVEEVDLDTRALLITGET